MEMLQGVWKQHLRPCAVVGYDVKIFLPSPPNYVTRSPGCSGFFARNSCCLISRSAAAFSRKKSTNGSARLDLQRFGQAPPSSELRFLVSLRLSIAFFLISSAVSLSLRCCFDANSAFACMVSSLPTNSVIPSPLTLPRKSHLPSLPRSSFC